MAESASGTGAQGGGLAHNGGTELDIRSDVPSFGVLLRQLRVAAGLSREKLAEHAGLSPKAVAALERGDRAKPRPTTVALLANALHVEPSVRTDLLSAAGYLANAQEVAIAQPTQRLPTPLTSLIGREVDVDNVRALLERTISPARLLTLVGPGGVGKTRVALAVGAELTGAYPDGVFFIDLAPLHEYRLVAATIARVLNIQEAGGRSARELVMEFLRGRQVLLILDNFEHLVAAAALVTELLTQCQGVAVLATSRTALRVAVERRFYVAPLGTSAAVRLFVERAQAILPDFVLDAQNEHTVAAVCRHLDGMPLAIELATARVPLLPPEALLRRLSHRLPILTGGAPDRPERQRTLRATLSWSHDLLGPVEQILFRRLSVFAGGWTLEAAEAVCAGADLAQDDVLDRLTVLVDSSLVHRTATEQGEARFRMLGTIREYAEECLNAAGEDAVVRNRHMQFFAALAEATAPHLHAPDQANWAAILEHEHDNLRSALTWARIADQPQVSIRLATTLRYFWYMHGHHREGRDRLTEALQQAEVAGVVDGRGQALGALGYLEAMQGTYEAARSHLVEALALGRQEQDAALVAFAGRYLGFVAIARGEYEVGRAHVEESFALYQELGRDDDAGAFLMYLGDAALAGGDLDAAERFFADSCTHLRRLQNVTVLPYPLRRLGHIALQRGDTAAALSLCLDSLRLNVQVQDPQGIAACLVGLAAVAQATGLPTRSAGLVGAAETVLESAGTQLFAADRQHYERTLAATCAELDPATFAAARSDGQQRGAEAAAHELVLEVGSRHHLRENPLRECD